MRTTITALAVTLVGAALVRPEYAARSAHLLLTLVITIVVVTAIARSFTDVATAAPGPFVPPPPPEPPTIATPDVAEIVQAVETARREIPAVVVSRLRDAASGRLADHHGLSIEEARDREAIRARVSTPMWSVLSARRGGPAGVPIKALPVLLDELEGL